MTLTWAELAAKIASMPARQRMEKVVFVEPYDEFKIHEVMLDPSAGDDIEDKDGKVVKKGQAYLY